MFFSISFIGQLLTSVKEGIVLFVVCLLAKICFDFVFDTYIKGGPL